MLTEYDEWNLSLRENGHISIRGMDGDGWDVPSTEFERLQHELTVSKPEFLEFNTCSGCSVIVARADISYIISFSPEFMRRYTEDQRERAAKGDS